MEHSAAVYVRHSKENPVGIARQEKLCRAVCKARGWEVIEVCADDDVSATGRVRRPAFDRLLKLIESGAVRVVVALDLDRLTRNHKDLIRLVDACTTHGVRVEFEREGGFDPVEGMGMLEVEIRTSVASEEVRKLRLRVLRQKQDRAERGLPNGGPRPYGYTSSRRDELVEHEAEAIRGAAERYLRGASLGDVARWLTDSGHLTTNGTLWSVSRIRRLLYRADLAALLEVNGERVAGSWLPILTVDQHEQLRARIDANTTRHRSPSQYLLSPPEAVAVCGKCGGVLAGGGARNRRLYRCKQANGSRSGGCGKTVIRADWLEEYVIAVSMGFATRPEVVAWRRDERTREQASSDEVRAELTKLDADERWLNDFAVETKMKASEYRRKLGDIEKRRAHVQRKLAKVQSAEEAITEAGGPAQARKVFDELTFNEKRRALRSLLVSVTVKPPVMGRTTFDPTRIAVRPDWGPLLEAAERGNAELAEVGRLVVVE